MKRNNVILTDFVPSEKWDFSEQLSEATKEQWQVKSQRTNHLHGSKFKTLLRYVGYFLFPLKIALSKVKYDNILAWQQFYGLNYTFFARILHLRKRSRVFVMTFIYKPKAGFLGKVYSSYIHYIVEGKYVDKLICFSRNECLYYKNLFKKVEDKFVYIPLGISVTNTLDSEVEKGQYLFTTGRSNRDYDFLLDTLGNTDCELQIACDSLNIRGGVLQRFVR